MANTFFYPPPDQSAGTLYIPSGTPLGVTWTSNYDSLNLRAFQLRSDGSYTYSNLLSDVSNPPGNGSYAWVAEVLDTTGAGMHFEITLASNGQSLDPFNSAVFYIDSGSAISTSLASTATTSSTSSLSASISTTLSTSSTTSSTSTGSPTSSQTSNPQHTSAVGLGAGLGLGIPIFLLILGLLGWTLIRRRKQKEVAPVAELAGPPDYYKHELPLHGPTPRAELEGPHLQEVHEAP